MIQLNILSGKMAGRQWVARHFPVRIGRASGCDLRLEEDGVWDQHADLNFDPDGGFSLKTQASALATVNGEPVQSARLRNGDAIHLGSVRLQFWLAATRQRGLQLREWIVWGLVAAVSAVEIAVVYYYLP
jgi:pSer/pThr/pTyr-binding forkhead associated (FHA) protein